MILKFPLVISKVWVVLSIPLTSGVNKYTVVNAQRFDQCHKHIWLNFLLLEYHCREATVYAFEKRKYVNKQVRKGQGLVGEVYQEGSTVYLTEVPEDYINITSGLGESNPRSILLTPLNLNDEIYGVVELASFKAFQPYQIEFVEK